MKFTIVALIAGICLAAVTANATVGEKPNDDFDLDSMADDEFSGEDYIDIETLSIMRGIYGVLKGTLRGLKGINCSIKEAIRIRQAAQDFLDAVQACGGNVSKQVQSLVKQCNSIISTCNDLINMNENICHNGDYNEETDGGKKADKSCYSQVLRKMNTLKKQIRTAINMIKKVPQTGKNANACVNQAVDQLKSAFTQFPTNVRTCSKLTS